MGMTDRNRLIGDRIKGARLAADLSQVAVAERMRDLDPDHQWSQATVWALEKGERALKAVEVEDLAQVVNIGTMYLFSTTRSTSAIRRLVAAHNDLVLLLRKLSLEEWRSAVARLELECNQAEKLVRNDRTAQEAQAERLPERIERSRNELANFRRLIDVLEDIGHTGDTSTGDSRG